MHCIKESLMWVRVEDLLGFLLFLITDFLSPMLLDQGFLFTSVLNVLDRSEG